MPAKKLNKKSGKKTIAVLRHNDKRRNLPTAEFQEVMQEEEKTPIEIAYERRNRDLDPQLVWRGKDEQDWSDLVVHAPPLYIQEKVHPKVLIDDLQRESTQRAISEGMQTPDLFADFNGLPKDARATEFYQHDANWSNRMILGDSLQVMASLAEREPLRGKIQCIYVDPPYGINFKSNFQWSTTSRDVKDNAANITREPEQVQAFRDTWRDGVHTYLTYLRDRLTVARDLLADSGSIFVQIGDENVHRVRGVMDEVFGEKNFCSQITVEKTRSQTSELIAPVCDFLLWYAKDKESVKYRPLISEKVFGEEGTTQYKLVELPSGEQRRLSKEELENPTSLPDSALIFSPSPLVSESASEASTQKIDIFGKEYRPAKGGWKTNEAGFDRLKRADRLMVIGNTPMYRRFYKDYPFLPYVNHWDDVFMTGFSEPKTYVVQTSSKAIARCVLMTTDPGDLVLDPTCGSGTTAYVAEQWGRRWITIDTSRVALALARARIMGARYPYYLLADSREGQLKEAEVTNSAPPSQPVHENIRHGFVYERVPHITLKSIANNAEIDVIWDKWQAVLAPLRNELNAALKKNWQEWEIPREPDEKWSDKAKKLHADWWQARIARQQEIDASIKAKAEFEFLYDKPYEDKNKIRVAGPFTVESVSPHRVLGVDEKGNVIDGWKISEREGDAAPGTPDFAWVILANLSRKSQNCRSAAGAQGG